ncbi:hypothetical protein DW802_05560 [Ruminococcus bromii]|jgi:predicted metal-dependent peptidase|nr:hypothetical protein DW802_05560 [Ruminococcus bromii]
MALSESKIKGCIKRLLLSRMRILYNHGFYGLLLMHMIYAVSEEIETACTDGVRITFGIDFLDSLSDSELDFVMMHEILHVVLQHCFRGDVEDPEAYNIAADIVVNSNIMLENGMKASSITLSKYGIAMHVAPDGKEGHEYTAEQVYAMLPKNLNKKGNNKIKVTVLLMVEQKKAIIKVQVLLSAGQKKRFQKNSINRYGYGMIIHGGASMKKMIHFVTYGSSGLKTQQKLLRSEIHQTQEAFSLLLPSVFLKN